MSDAVIFQISSKDDNNMHSSTSSKNIKDKLYTFFSPALYRHSFVFQGSVILKLHYRLKAHYAT